MTENSNSNSVERNATGIRSDSTAEDSSIASKPGRRSTNKGRLQLLLVVLVFLSPWIFAVMWKSSDRINHGTLIEPPRLLPDASLIQEDGAMAPAQDLRGKWTWVVLADGNCDEKCVSRVDLVRQVRIAQKKNYKRLRYALVVVESGSESSERTGSLDEATKDSHPDLMIRFAQRQQHDEFLGHFGFDQNDQSDPYGQIFVVDPLGNLMMSYPAASEPEHLHRDMTRLLKASHLG